MNLQDTLAVLEKLLSLAIAFQCFEFLAIRSSWSEGGIWKWSILRAEYPHVLAQLLTPFLSEGGFRRLQHGRLILCAFILIFPASTLLNGALLGLLFLASYLTSIRWRGAFNGGSDSLTLINLLLLTLSACFNPPEAGRICLLLIAVNLASTFVLSGVAKLFDRDWRRGHALPLLLSGSNSSLRPLESPTKALVASWLLIAFELLFPLAFASRPLAIAFVACAMVFHFLNWKFFGLNRFLFVWGATYPVVFYFAI